MCTFALLGAKEFSGEETELHTINNCHGLKKALLFMIYLLYLMYLLSGSGELFDINHYDERDCNDDDDD